MLIFRHPALLLYILLIVDLLLIFSGINAGKKLERDKEKKKKSKSRLVATVPGDIILGGLFPVHSSGAVKCMSLNPERGIQRLEGMLFTLDEINNNSALLPGLRLGANLRDTCSLGNHALEQSLDFVKTTVDDVMNEPKEQDRVCVCPCAPGGVPYCPGGGQRMPGATMPHPTSWSQDIVRGVVGGSYTTVSILVANLYRLFKLPQISYASTSAVLSDKRTYPLFARTVPSDVEQARVMAALVAAHNWTYVSTVRSAGDYGDSGMDAFWKEADKRDVCIAAREVVRGSSSSNDLDEVVRVLRYGFSKARVVVLFTRMDHTKLLLDAVRRANHTDHFVFIGSDGWGRENMPVLNNSRVANGALTIEILATEIEKFSTYYKNLRWDNTRNPWFAKYWQSLFGCTFDNSSTQPNVPHCEVTKNKRLGDKLPEPFKQEAKIQFVYDAVYALAHGLHNLQQKLCPFDPDPAKWDKNECIRKLLAYPGDEFYKIIISTTFKDNYNNLVAFDENGDGVGQYLIYNYARDLYSGEYQYRLVGDYKNSKLSMRYRPIWPGGQSKLVPSSQCSEECPLWTGNTSPTTDNTNFIEQFCDGLDLKPDKNVE
ncbi:unnamed protein product [Taenia asiatica]|uniref:ANF_receptor domain-containing protein n=1 Tax=Taenia asiatica TaxID=60517 RepID=A0A0R3WC03_TAEAS|nr:unnamed protein product [Taenia asiatica]